MRRRLRIEPKFQRLEQRAKSGRRLAVRLDESRIGIDAGMHALAQNEEGKVGRELGMVRSACRSLHAVVRPQRLVAVGKPLHLERR